MNKKIAFVKEVKNKVQVYNTKGDYMFTKYGAVSNYTTETISIKETNGSNRTYDANGSYKFTR